MTAKEFEQILKARTQKMVLTLGRKAGEYATADDRLHTFKEAARLGGLTPAEALMGMWLKHVVSVCDMVREQSAGKPITQDRVDDKIGDAINYLVLLEAVFAEKPTTAEPAAPPETAGKGESLYVVQVFDEEARRYRETWPMTLGKATEEYRRERATKPDAEVRLIHLVKSMPRSGVRCKEVLSRHAGD